MIDPDARRRARDRSRDRARAFGTSHQRTSEPWCVYRRDTTRGKYTRSTRAVRAARARLARARTGANAGTLLSDVVTRERGRRGTRARRALWSRDARGRIGRAREFFCARSRSAAHRVADRARTRAGGIPLRDADDRRPGVVDPSRARARASSARARPDRARTTRVKSHVRIARAATAVDRVRARARRRAHAGATTPRAPPSRAVKVQGGGTGES